MNGLEGSRFHKEMGFGREEVGNVLDRFDKDGKESDQDLDDLLCRREAALVKVQVVRLGQRNKRRKEKRGNGTHEMWRGIVYTNGAGYLLPVSGSVRGAPIPYL